MDRNDALLVRWEHAGLVPVGFVGTTAALIGAGIAAAGSVGSAAISASGAKSAAKTQASAAEKTAQLYEPFREAGTGAVSQLSDLLAPGGELTQPWTQTFTPPDVTEDPGYQFRLEQGQQALERSAAARGGVTTGGTAKELTRYSQDVASQEYANAYARRFTEYQLAYGQFQQNQANLYNRLMGLTQVGVQGAGGAGQALTQGGAATASGQVGSANAWAGGVQEATQSIGDLVLLQSLLKGNKTKTQPSNLVTPYSNVAEYGATGGVY